MGRPLRRVSGIAPRLKVALAYALERAGGSQLRDEHLLLGIALAARLTIRAEPACVSIRRGACLDYTKISSYSFPVPRRKAGTLLPLETEILAAALSMLRAGHAAFHGFGLAQTMREDSGSRSLTAHGTLYKALGRLEEFGMLTSRWEDAAAAVEGRPRRRLYELTGEGARAAESVRAENGVAPRSRVASVPA